MPFTAKDDGTLALDGPFKYLSHPVEVTITPTHLCLHKNGPSKVELAWLDILGASEKDGTLTVFSLPKDKKGRRYLHTYLLKAEKDAVVDENYVQVIRYMAKHFKTVKDKMPTMEEIAQNPVKQQRCVVIVNPVGGTGRANSIFDTKVEPILRAANVLVEKIVTQRAAHGTELGETLDLKASDFIICVGGDGLVCEVIQGLMKRKDWHEAIKHPIGIIPGGSGNGLAKSFLHVANEEYSAENSAFIIVKGSSQPIDIATTKSAKTCAYSILSLSWAFIADVDLDSEGFRFMGSARFTMAAVVKVLSFKRWSGRLTYLAADTIDDDHYWDKYANSEHGPNPILSIVDTIDENPDLWKTIEGNFSLFWATNVSHPTWDGHVAPGACLSDGLMHLIVVEGNASVINMAKILLGFENGSHVKVPGVQIISTRAYQLTVNENDLLSLDGERFEGNVVKVEVHRGLGRVMCVVP